MDEEGVEGVGRREGSRKGVPAGRWLAWTGRAYGASHQMLYIYLQSK